MVLSTGKARFRARRNGVRWVSAVAGVAAAAAVLSACGSSGSDETTGAAATGSAATSAATTSGGSGATSTVRVGLAQSGPPNDHAFAQAAHEGALRAQKELGIKLTEIDNLTTPATQTAALTNLARANDLVMFDDTFVVKSIPQQFPKTQFLAQNGVLQGGANTHSQVVDWWPVSYLAGVVAGSKTKSNVIGYVSGSSAPDDAKAGDGFAAGAKSVNPKIKVVRASTGSYTDAAKGKATAQAEIADGADILYSALDTAHQGLVQAVKDSGKDIRVMSALDPRCDISQGLDIGDALVDLRRMTYEAIKTYAEQGTLPKVLSHGLDDQYTYFRFCPGESTPALAAAVAKAKAGLTSGAIKP